MQFWQEKRRRRVRTLFSLALFFLLAIIVSYLFELTLRWLAREGYISPMPYLGFALMGFIFLVTVGYYCAYATTGGKLAAESMGGWEVDPLESSPEVMQLVHIVEEMAIASRLPIPAIYIIRAQEINAFAAGLKPNKSVIAVTTGALEQLSREELQGVIAHEFGHIASGDMKIGMQIAALVMGFFIIFYIGLRLLEGSFFMGRGSNGERKSGPILLIALLLLLSGALLWFAGTILRACVSREREYLADASAVQFTRNPQGLIGALTKIKAVNEQVHDMPKSGLGYAHLYFDHRSSIWGRLFATHPPLEKRIEALKGTENLHH